MNEIFTAMISLVLLFLFRNSTQLEEQNSTETIIYYNSSSDAEESAFPTESLDNSSSEPFPSSDSVTELSGSDSSTENSTDLDNATDYMNQTDVTTFVPPEEERHTNVWVHHNETFCSCDLYIESCDVNCCCDHDCSEEDIEAFPSCFSTSSVSESDYCFDSDIVFRNNTPYQKIVNEAKGLFCIAHDNFQERLKYKDVPSFSSIQEFEKLYAMDVFSWNQNFIKMDKPVLPEVMKAGDQLYRTASLSPTDMRFKWRLPSSCFTTLCECGKDILYMEDVESSCVHPFSSTEEFCKTNPALSVNYFKDFCVWSKTSSKPHTEDVTEITTTESTTEITTETEGGQQCIAPSDQPTQTPHFDHSSKSCLNVVQSVNYTVFHDGTFGITDIKLHFRLRNISAEESFFRQQFSVKFEWNSKGNYTFKRSGNPGYQIGFPVLTGTDNNKAHPAIKMNDYGLTIMEKDAFGLCTHDRKAVYFAQNVKSGCYVRGEFSNCKVFQEEIKTLLGINEAPTFVGSFGNADPQNSADWLEVFHEGSSQNEQSEDGSLCNEKLITGLMIDVAYAAVGLLANPQHKIVGTVFRYIRTPNVHLKSINHYSVGQNDHFYSNTVEISISVTFHDVSQTAVPAYSRLPVLRAKLPYDFFYPFLLSSSQSNIVLEKCHIILICSTILLKTFEHFN